MFGCGSYQGIQSVPAGQHALLFGQHTPFSYGQQPHMLLENSARQHVADDGHAVLLYSVPFNTQVCGHANSGERGESEEPANFSVNARKKRFRDNSILHRVNLRPHKLIYQTNYAV